MSFEEDLLKAQQTMGVSPDAGNAEQELAGFGIEALPANIEMVEACMNSTQVNDPEKPIYELSQQVMAGNADEAELRKMLEEHVPPIKKIVHAEGVTIWDHVKTGLKQIEEMDVDEKKKAFYKIIFLYHDIGKTDAKVREANAEKNSKPVNEKTGQYSVSFVGHADFENMDDGKGDKVREAFAANGFSDEEVETGMWLIAQHMSGGIIDAKSKIANAAKIYNATTPEAYQDLIRVLQVDGGASVHFTVDEGYSNNETKSNIDGEKQLANIETYNEVMAILDKAGDDKTRVKMGNEANAFFKKVNNFDDIDPAAVEALKAKMIKMTEAPVEKPVPPELKKLGGVLRDKTKAVAQVYDKLVAKKGNEKALQGMAMGLLKKQLGLSDEQVAAVLATLE
jgi:hypothetical protein